MIETIIDTINSTLSLPQGSRVQGVAELVFKGTEYSPWLIDKNGEGKYAGFDNTLSVSIYHKINDVTVQAGRNGFGDDLGDLVNTYNCTLVVYLNRKKTNLTPIELMLSIQNQFPSAMKIKPYQNIVIRFLKVILNSTQIWLQEYQGVAYNLPTDSNLFAINYQIESTFKKGCFINC